MKYQQIVKKLQNEGYIKVERDDRILDIFPDQTRAKGIELWEKWDANTVHLTRIHEPQDIQSVTEHSVSRTKLELALTTNQPLSIF